MEGGHTRFFSKKTLLGWQLPLLLHFKNQHNNPLMSVLDLSTVGKAPSKRVIVSANHEKSKNSTIDLMYNSTVSSSNFKIFYLKPVFYLSIA